MSEAAVDVIVVGAGPAGITAAITAARLGRSVVLLEKAARPGVKILISGGNRCNLTHDCDAPEIARAFGRRGAKYLGVALRELGPRALRRWIETLGVATKVEPGGKVFPVSDRAVDVRDALERELERSGVRFVGGAAVSGVTHHGGKFQVAAAGRAFTAPRLVLALGGRSYPKVGTTGDGYALARALGLEVTATKPALVPLIVDVPWVRALSGVTLTDAELTLRIDGKTAEAQRGPLLFTHFGLSGPAPMNLGGGVESASGPRDLVVDFVPGQRAVIEKAAAADRARSLRTFLSGFVPRRLADALLEVHGLRGDRPLAQTPRLEFERALAVLSATELPVSGTRGYDFAEVTRGGVDLNEIDPATLEAHRTPGLFVCGELLDLDGPIGGYNFTAAFATGALAGKSAAKR